MFSKIFFKSPKARTDKKETGKQQQHQQQPQQKQQHASSSSSSPFETSPHHIYHPLQMRQQYPQLYQQQQQQFDHYKTTTQHQQQQQQQQQQHFVTTKTTTTTATSFESLFHPSKLVTNLTESPGRSRKLRREFDVGRSHGNDGEVDNNIQNESAEQKQQQKMFDDKTFSDVGAMTYDCCHGNEISPQKKHTSNNSLSSSFNVTVQQGLTNSPIYNFMTTSATTPQQQSANNNNNNNNEELMTSSQIDQPIIDQIFNNTLCSPPNNIPKFRNSSQQDLQQYNIQQQQQQHQLQQISDKEAKFFPVRYRSLSAGDHSNFTFEISEQVSSKDEKTANKCNKWGSENEEEKWGGRGEKVVMRGGSIGGAGGLLWGKKHVAGSNPISTPKSTSSEQFYRSIIGQVFLICGKEMKRCVLLQKISSMDAVRQIFSQAFSDAVRIDEFYGHDPQLAIYILDAVAAVFYELEDFREVRNLSVLKIFEKRSRNKNETLQKNKSPKKKKAIKMAAEDIQINAGGQQINILGSVQSLPPPSPQSRPEIDALKMKSREVCCFGGVLGYQKLPKTVLPNPKQTSLESDVNSSSQNSTGVEAGTSVTTSTESTKTTSDLQQAKQYHSLDRYHSSGCNHHHHHHRNNKKAKTSTQSANASPSNDPYSIYGPHCNCCRHYCNYDTHVQRCHHNHHHHQPSQANMQSPAKQPKSPIKSQQRYTWAAYPPHCHNSCRPLSDSKGGGESNTCLLPVDLLNITTGAATGITTGGNANNDNKRPLHDHAMKASTNEMETRMRISQLEDQLASLTQWVQDSIEAERSGQIPNVQNVPGLDVKMSSRNQALETIQGRLGVMLKDVSTLRDQCQHLKVAHQIQRQEVRDTLAFFSQKILAFVNKGLISEDILWSSLAQDITVQLNNDPMDNQRLLESTRAELHMYGELPYDELKEGGIATYVADDTSSRTINAGKVQSIKPYNSLPGNNDAKIPARSDVSSSPKNRESTHSPDLVRSNRGIETETSSNLPSNMAALTSVDETHCGDDSSKDVWISMDTLKKLSTR